MILSDYYIEFTFMGAILSAKDVDLSDSECSLYIISNKHAVANCCSLF